ncbi:MAG: hypothetical protein KHZ15_07000 [Coprobacillus cateniformis]|uniref:DUF3658 domain-containing protein n=1 Tax=Longibaculum muris TaxID=1796628 RepID=UPI003AB5F245|nr:hypothetical protein [Coprobacillus cateniformis]
MDNDDIVDILFGGVCIGDLRMNRIKLNYLSFDFNLYLGDISLGLSSLQRRKVYDMDTKYCDEDYQDFAYEDIKKFEQSIQKFHKIRIWASLRCPNDYMNLLYLVSRYSNKDIYVVSIPPCQNKDYYNQTIYDKVEFCEKLDNLYDLEYHLLTELEKQELSEEWEKQVKINSDIRLLENEIIVNKSYSDYFQLVLSVIDEEYLDAWDICDRCHLSYITMLQVILNEMVDKQILDIELEESPYQKGWVSARYKKNMKLN